ncbi:hypothetical protein ASD10_10300 [Aeromicrobium sp. Root472D3]|nr:hypothetical protein ASD10_10300 [Aeromicrobium sp. Root472D3]MBD8606048.1 plasmid stability protein [Aeromicrobium sp. CFBP 8757]
MAAVTVRGIPDEVHRALKGQAVAHGRSTEAEIREILRRAVSGPEDARMGDRLSAIGERHGGLDLDVVRDDSPPEPAEFS